MTLFVNNIKISEEDFEKYNNFKFLAKCLRSKEDIQMLFNVYSLKIKNKDLIKIIENSLNCYGNKNILGIDSFFDLIEELDKIIYYNDAIEFIENNYNKINDEIQLNTIKRIIDEKPRKIKNISIKEFNLNENDKNKNKITKFCPHCKKKEYGYEDTKYIICGYSKGKYDWIGCGNDWCFKCGKKLCKNWLDDELFIPKNRNHNSYCCKKNAKKVKEDINNYCFCNFT